MEKLTGIAIQEREPAVSKPEITFGQNRGLILLLAALSSFGPLSIDMYLPGLPDLRSELGTSASQTQLTLSACLIGLAAGQLLAGPLSDARGRRGPLLIGLVGYAVGSLLCAFAPSVGVLIGLRFLQGFAGSAGLVISRAVVRDLTTGKSAAALFSLLMLVNGAAPVLAPILGGQLLRYTSWRGVFLVLAVIGAVLFILTMLTLPETSRPEDRQSGGLAATLTTFRQLLADRAFMGFAVSAGLAIGAMFTYISGSTFVLQEIYGVSPQVFSVLFGINALGLMAAGYINRRLVDRTPLSRLLFAGLCQSAVGGLLLLGAILSGHAGLQIVLPAFFMIVASLGFILPNATALALANHPRIAGTASALIGLTQYGIGAAAAPLAGIAGEGTALPMALTIAVLSLGALLLYQFVAAPASRREQMGEPRSEPAPS